MRNRRVSASRWSTIKSTLAFSMNAINANVAKSSVIITITRTEPRRARSIFEIRNRKFIGSECRQGLPGERQGYDTFAHQLVISEFQPQPLGNHGLAALRIHFQERFIGTPVRVRIIIIVAQPGYERCDDAFAWRI